MEAIVLPGRTVVSSERVTLWAALSNLIQSGVEAGLVSPGGSLRVAGGGEAALEESSGAGKRGASCLDDEQAEPKRMVTTAAAQQLCLIMSGFSSGLAPMWSHLYLD